jgi:hypothetical protein
MTKTMTVGKTTKRRQDDGFGNEVEYMTWEQFQDFVTNRGMWCKGDCIQVKNKDGSVISTSILIEDGESN